MYVFVKKWKAGALSELFVGLYNSTTTFMKNNMFGKTLEIDLLYDSEVPLLGIHIQRN